MKKSKILSFVLAGLLVISNFHFVPNTVKAAVHEWEVNLDSLTVNDADFEGTSAGMCYGSTYSDPQIKLVGKPSYLSYSEVEGSTSAISTTERDIAWTIVDDESYQRDGKTYTLGGPAIKFGNGYKRPTDTSTATMKIIVPFGNEIKAKKTVTVSFDYRSQSWVNVHMFYIKPGESEKTSMTVKCNPTTWQTATVEVDASVGFMNYSGNDLKYTDECGIYFESAAVGPYYIRNIKVQAVDTEDEESPWLVEADKMAVSSADFNGKGSAFSNSQLKLASKGDNLVYDSSSKKWISADGTNVAWRVVEKEDAVCGNAAGYGNDTAIEFSQVYLSSSDSSRADAIIPIVFGKKITDLNSTVTLSFDYYGDGWREFQYYYTDTEGNWISKTLKTTKEKWVTETVTVETSGANMTVDGYFTNASGIMFKTCASTTSQFYIKNIRVVAPEPPEGPETEFGFEYAQVIPDRTKGSMNGPAQYDHVSLRESMYVYNQSTDRWEIGEGIGRESTAYGYNEVDGTTVLYVARRYSGIGGYSYDTSTYTGLDLGQIFTEANNDIVVEIEYYDCDKSVPFSLWYNKKNATGVFQTKSGETVQVKADNTWKTAVFEIKDEDIAINTGNYATRDLGIKHEGGAYDKGVFIRKIRIMTRAYKDREEGKNQFSFGGLAFANGELTMTDNGKVTGVVVKNAFEKSVNGKVFVGLYKDKALMSANVCNIPEIPAGKAQVVELPLDLPSDVTGYEIKTFLFEDGIKPLTKANKIDYVKNESTTIYLAGDSTVCDYEDSYYPQAGWGQLFGNYFNENVKIDNRAIGGRSSKSFIDEGRLQGILDDIKPGDYVMIQFAHNDQKTDSRYTNADTTYKVYLEKYIRDIREKGAYPIFVTATPRRSFLNDVFVGDETNEQLYPQSLGKYPDAMRDVATQYAVPLLDLTKEWTEVVETSGSTDSKKYYLYLTANDSRFDSVKLANSSYKNGNTDDTHFNIYGADYIASIVVELMKEKDLPLCEYLTDYKPAEVPAYN